MHENNVPKVFWRPKNEDLSETIGRILGNFHEHEAFDPLITLSPKRKVDLLEYALERVLKQFSGSSDQLKIIVLLSLDYSFQKAFIECLQNSDAMLLAHPDEVKALLNFISLFQQEDIIYLERKNPITVALEKIAFSSPSEANQKAISKRRTYFLKNTFQENELGKFEDPKYDQDCVCIWEAIRLSMDLASQCTRESIDIFENAFESKGCNDIQERFYYFAAHAQKSSQKTETALIDFALSDCEALLFRFGSNTPHDLSILESQSFLVNCLMLEALISTDSMKQALAPRFKIPSPQNFLLLAEISRYQIDENLADNILYQLNSQGSPFWRNEKQYRPLEQLLILAGTAILLQVHDRPPEDLAQYLSDQLIAFKDIFDPRNMPCKFDRALYAKEIIEIILTTSHRLGAYLPNTTFQCLKSILRHSQDDLNQQDFDRIRRLFDNLNESQLSEILTLTSQAELRTTLQIRSAIYSATKK